MPTSFTSARLGAAIVVCLAVFVGASGCSRSSDNVARSPSPSVGSVTIGEPPPDGLAGVIPSDPPDGREQSDQRLAATGNVELSDVLFEAGEHERRPLDETATAALTAAVLDAFVASDLPWTSSFVSISLVEEPGVTDGLVEHWFLAYVLTEHGVAHAEVNEQQTSDSGGDQAASVEVYITDVQHTIGGCVVWLDNGPVVNDCI